MNTRTQQFGQVETMTLIHEGHEFTHMASSVDGKHISGYMADGELQRASGATMLTGRMEKVETYRDQYSDKSHAVIFRLPRSRFIAGYALDDAGDLFRGELLPQGEGQEDAERLARSIAENCLDMAAEEDAQFQAEQAAEHEEENHHGN